MGDKVSQDAPPEPDHLSAARELSLAAMIVVLGVVTPMLFHVFGAGSTFLPMHIPILAGGMLLSPSMAALAGATTPLVSAALTGMPPFAPPVAPLMTAELAAIAATASVLRRRLRAGLLVATIGAILAGRAVYACELFMVAPLLGIRLPAAAAGAVALLKGWPGLLLQMAIVPATVAAVERTRRP
ncbi:MAG: ECF transporter S component [Armatimonadetes bacterium]|nr:ECF transporter S component [Armatimonadota bacterium]